MSAAHDDAILEPGRNCWRVERAERVGVIIGGEHYFRALRHALLAARRRVVILAWDLRSDIRLERDGADDDFPVELGPFLNALLERREELEIRLLVWDFSVIYAAEREWPLFSESLRERHPRLHFVFDDELPVGASHHQKLVVVDDALAFAGGIDPSAWRWDRASHPLHEPGRTDPHGESYRPYHDLHLALTGPIVGALAKLASDRWQRATGAPLEALEDPPSPPWPDTLEPDFESLPVGLARSYAPHEPWPGVREVERFHLDLIAAARDYLYLENQYFSSRRLSDALAERLREEDGPEIVIVITRKIGSWLEEGTMGQLRDRLFRQLVDADTHDRLRIYYPWVADESGKESVEVYVHAKVAIADDRVFKVGSANLSNRSMRLDSELEMVIERPAADERVRTQLHRLLGIHFAIEPSEVSERLADAPGLGAAIDSWVRDHGHTLRPFPVPETARFQRLLDPSMLDPDEPIDPDYWVRDMVPEEERPGVARRMIQLALIVALGIGLSFLVKQGWGDWIDHERLVATLDAWRDNPWLPLLLAGCFVVAGLIGFPLNLLLVAAVTALDPWLALGAGFVGAFLAALTGFGLGHGLGRRLLQRLAPKACERLEHHLARRGLFSIVFVRIVPVGPFVLVNLVAGASGIGLRPYCLGTLIGMAPGMAAVVLLTHQVTRAVGDPGWGSILGAAATALVVLGALFLLGRSLLARHHD